MQVWDAATDSYIVFDAAHEDTSSPSSSTSSSTGVVSWTVENDVTVSAIESRLHSLVQSGANLEVCHQIHVADIFLPGVTSRRRSSKGNGERLDFRIWYKNLKI